MAVRISGDGSISGLTDWEATSVTHPESADTNITLADDGSVAFDSIPADILAAIPAGIGSNVVQTVKTDVFTTTSGSYVTVTGLSATITPSSATSKVLVVAFVNASATLSTDDQTARFTIFRGATDLASTERFGAVGRQRANRALQSLTFVFLDSPSTTSPVTYDVRVEQGGGTARVNQSQDGVVAGESSITLIEVEA